MDTVGFNNNNKLLEIHHEVEFAKPLEVKNPLN